MAAWQIPLAGTPAPRENPFQAMQQGELNQQHMLASQEQVKNLQSEEASRAQQTEAAKIQNNQAHHMEQFFSMLTTPPPAAQPGAAATPGTLGAAAPTANPADTQGFGSATASIGSGINADDTKRTLAFDPQAAAAPPAQAPAAAAAPAQPKSWFDKTYPGFDNAMDWARKQGYGSVVMAGSQMRNQALVAQTEMATKQAALEKDHLDNLGKQYAQVANVLMSVKSAGTPEQQKTQYEQYAVPVLQRMMAEQGQDPKNIDTAWDPNKVDALISKGYDGEKQTLILGHLMDAKMKAGTELPKMQSEWQKSYYQDLRDINPANPAAQDVLDAINKKHAKLASYDQSGMATQIFNGMREDKLTPDIAQRAQDQLLTPEERMKAPAQRRAETAVVLAAAPTYGEYENRRRLAGTAAQNFADFSSKPRDAAIAPADVAAIRRLGMTNEEATRADETASRDRRTAAQQEFMRRNMTDRLNKQRDWSKPQGTGTPTQQHKDMISGLADQAIAESNANGGGSGNQIADARKNVQNTDFYVNHPIGRYRGEVDDELRRRLQAQKNLDRPVGKTGKGFEAFDAQVKSGSAPAPAAAPASAPPRSPSPAQSQPAPKQTFTEGEVRQRASAAGHDPDLAVKAARDAGLLK